MAANTQATVIRAIDGHPHLGAVLVCGDFIGVTDVNEAIDSINIAVTTGINASTQSARAYNMGSVFLPTVGPNTGIITIPIIGQSMGALAWPRNWVWNGPLEFVDGLDKFCLTMTVRLLGDNEFGFLQGTPNFSLPGGRAGRFRVSLSSYNSAGIVTTQGLLELYSDLAYFQTAHPTIAVNLPIAIDRNSIGGDGFKRITILGSLDSGMTQQNRANVGRLNFNLDYIEKPSGGPWPANTAYGPRMPISSHPVTGDPLACDGVHDYSLYLFR